jgi:hypothetical protein
VHQVGYLQELNRDARSTEHKIQQNIKIFSGLHAHQLRIKIHCYQNNNITDNKQPPNKDILILFRQIHIQYNTEIWTAEDYAMCGNVVW